MVGCTAEHTTSCAVEFKSLILHEWSQLILRLQCFGGDSTISGFWVQGLFYQLYPDSDLRVHSLQDSRVCSRLGCRPTAAALVQNSLLSDSRSTTLGTMMKPLALVFYESSLPGSQLVNQLQDLGYRVVTHTEAATLVAQAQQAKPFVMVMDLAGRVSDVCDLIRQLRSTPDTTHIPILAFAEAAQQDLREKAREAGANLVAGDAALASHLPQLLAQALEIDS
jgi:two-component system, cell cycle response regulator DivK